jgi:outer membrane usher protein FimD/PapC
VAGETYVKRPLIDLKANLALGDVSSNSPIIGSTPIRGVRLSSEENMLPDEERSFRPVIKGVARTNARVRISQNNTVFFEQTVPPGPFEFDDINPVSSVGNLQVVIAEADGSQQTFTVPYSPSAGKLNPGSLRYSIATGLYRNFTSTQNTTVVQAYLRYGFNDFTTPGMAYLFIKATDYNAKVSFSFGYKPLFPMWAIYVAGGVGGGVVIACLFICCCVVRRSAAKKAEEANSKVKKYQNGDVST